MGVAWRSTVLVLLAAFAACASFLQGGFAWHDHGDLLGGRALHGPVWGPYGGSSFFRPLVALSFRLDHALFGLAPAGYHVTSVLFHALAAVAALHYARRLAGEADARFAAVVFAVHPLAWQPAGVLAYRSEPMAAGASLAAVVLLRGCLVQGRRGQGAAAVLLAVMALTSKEAALWWLPAFWLLLPELGAARKRGLMVLLGLCVAALVARWTAVGGVWPVASEPLTVAQHKATALAAIARRALDLGGFWLPSLNDAVQVAGPLDPWAWLGAAMIAACLYFALRGWLEAWQGWRLAALLVVLVLPAMNLLPLPRWSSPHYWYLAPLPLALMVARALRRLPSKLSLARWAWPLSIALVTATGGPRLVDDVALFSPDVARAPENRPFREGHQWLGHAAWTANPPDAARAATHLQAAIAPVEGAIAYVDAATCMFNLAGARIRLGEFRAAELLLDTLVARPPPTKEAQTAELLAYVAGRRGDLAKAESALLRYPRSARGEAMLARIRKVRAER